MPVYFKGNSEYNRHFIWRDSFKSKSFTPSEDQAARQAGLHTAFYNTIRREPELQHRKRVPLGPGEVFHMKPMEPSMQAKKRAETAFAKTSPIKPASEPTMQSKKRVEPTFIKQKELPETYTSVEIQSKKKHEAPVSAMQCEPPLQSKRRTPGPPTTLSNGFHQNESAHNDFALLGNQDKFTENVKYKVRPAQQSRDISPPKQMKLQKKEKENKFPSPGPVVDTSQFSKPSTPMAPRKQKVQLQQQAKELKESNVWEQPQKKVVHSPKQSANEPTKPSLRKPEQVERLNLENLESPVVKIQPQATKENLVAKKPIEQKKSGDDPKPALPKKVTTDDLSKKDLPKNTNEKKVPKLKAEYVITAKNKNLDVGDPVKDSMKTKKIGNMNEFVQTNMDKGIADSAAEAPAEYALKYKSGVAPPRPTKKLSEYQKQFAWKKGYPASPLLKAEQVVYNNVPSLSAPKKDVIPKVTEYQKQFKEFALVPVPKQERSEPVHSKRNQLPRSKSMEGLAPADIPTAGSSPVIASNNKRLTMETDQRVVEPAPVVPRKKQRQFRSEYDSNFKSPTKFDYLRGSWHGADPPQVKIKGPEDKAADSCLSNWFAEVIELRRKASEYRKRAEGTHFSREHCVQLMAKQADLWDASTLSARSNLSALSLESGLAAHKNKQGSKEKLFKEGYSTAATIDSVDDHDVGSMIDVERSETPPVKRQAWMEQDLSDDDSQRASDVGYTQEGRLTTPEYRDQIFKDGNQRRRHHLERTTPCVGGALLSSPPNKKKNRSGKKMVPSSDGSVVSETVEEDIEEFEQRPVYRSLAGQKTYGLDRGCITPTPTSGVATKDTHALRDDDASVDRAWPSQYVHSPVRGKRDRPGGLETIGEGFGETYNKTRGKNNLQWTIDGGLPVPRLDCDDDDALSVSMQSIASSCSVASATLERARKRKDEFWGKNGIATR